jgi:ferric enterobactin receptor
MHNAYKAISTIALLAFNLNAHSAKHLCFYFSNVSFLQGAIKRKKCTSILMFRQDTTLKNGSAQQHNADKLNIDTLKEVVVKGKRLLIKQNVDRSIITVENNNLFKGSNLEEVLEKIPGIVIDANNRLQINGNSSIKFQINGHDVPLSSGSVSTLLKSVQSSSIKSLEIINASAKSDAQGSAQILNINTLQPITGDFIVNPGITFSQGKYSKAGVNLFAQTRIKKFSFQILAFGDRSDEYSTEQSSRLYQNASSLQNDGNELNRKRSFFSKFDINYELNKSNDFGVSIYNYFTRQSANINNIFRVENEGQTDSVTSNKGNQKINLNYSIYSGFYRHLFDNDKHYLLFNIDFNKAGNQQDNLYFNQLLNGGQPAPSPAQNTFSNSKSDIYLPSAYINYSKPLFGEVGTLEMGVKYVLTKDHENYNYLDATSSDFQYRETVTSGYLSFLYERKAWSFQTGLRGERTESEGRINTLQTSERDYFNLFPSISVQKKFDSDNITLTLRYNRRIQRPNFLSLSPFIYYTSPYEAFKGDPGLSPTFINDYSLSLNAKGLYLTGSYIHLDNLITALPLVSTDLSTIINQYYNIGSQNVRSVNLSYPFNIKAINFTPSINADITTSNLLINSETIKRNTNNVFFNLGGAYKYSKTGRIELKAFYVPRVETIYSTINHKSAVTIRYIKTFFNGNLSCRAAVEDIFNGNKESGRNQLAGYVGTFSSFYDNRRCSLSLTYTLRKGKRISILNNSAANDENNTRIKGQ